MTVYKATTPKQYSKIADFIRTQYATSCVKLDVSDVNRECLDVWVVEDNAQKIRLVMSVERRGSLPKEPKILTRATLCTDKRDRLLNNTQFYEELHRHLFKVYPPQGYLKGEFFGNEEVTAWTKRFFGDKMKIREESWHPTFGKVYLYELDFSEAPP